MMAERGRRRAAVAEPVEVQLKVVGMTCHHCVMSVSEALEEVPGVEQVEVSLEAEQARVVYDPAMTNLEALSHAVQEVGYQIA